MKRLICIINIIILMILCCCAREKEEFSMPEPTLTVTAEATPTITPSPTPTAEPTPTPINTPTVIENNVPSDYKGKYIITVNILKNFVSVYEKNEDGFYTELVKSFVCSAGIGPGDNFTPTGGFYTSDKYEWRPLFGGTFGRYATRITGAYLFHSVPYISQKKDALKSEEYNKLGDNASQGCIRLTVRDAKWLYDNCAKKTFVYIYEKDEPVPSLEPFATIDLSDVRCGWDPTDTDVSNPWKYQSEKSTGCCITQK